MRFVRLAVLPRRRQPFVHGCGNRAAKIDRATEKMECVGCEIPLKSVQRLHCVHTSFKVKGYDCVCKPIHAHSHTPCMQCTDASVLLGAFRRADCEMHYKQINSNQICSRTCTRTSGFRVRGKCCRERRAGRKGRTAQCKHLAEYLSEHGVWVQFNSEKVATNIGKLQNEKKQI